MCTNNRDGELPSCLAAKYDGPGCEQWDLCFQCADTLKAEKDKLLLQIDEMRKDFAEIEEISRMNFDGDQAPMGCIMSVADKHIPKCDCLVPAM